MVFPQGQDEGDVILCELVMEGDPVFPCVLPLFHDRAVAAGKLLLKAQLHQTAESGNKLRKRRDKAVGQGEAHGLQQPAFGLVLPLQRVAGDGAGYSQIDIGRGDSPLRGTQCQRGLGYGQCDFKLSDTMEIPCP